MKKSKHIFMLLLAALLLLAAACNNRQGDSGLVKQTGEPTSAEPASDAPTNMTELTRAPTQEPTDESTPEPTKEAKKERPSDEWFIEQAWPVAQRVGEIYGLKLAKETACVFGSTERFVELRESDSEDAKGVLIEFEDNEHNNDFVIDMSDSVLLGWREYDEDTAKEITEWWKYWSEQRVVVTPEDIVTAGCTETEGDEYMLTVARLCSGKIAELLTGAPEDFPARCIKAAVARCNYSEREQSGYYVSIPVIPEDPHGFELFFDYDMTLFENEAYPEFWGWCRYGGRLELEREGDNWVAGVYLDRGEGR